MAVSEANTLELEIDVVVYREADGFTARCLNVEVASQGATEAEALANIAEAVALFLEDAGPSGLSEVSEARVNRVAVPGA
jgi:predicted RNase H-like HicB family nuclease